MKKAQFQMDCFGNFRIVRDGKEGTPTGYEGIACLEVNGETYIAVSCYYCIPKPEKVFKLVPVETGTILEHAPVCNLFRPEDPCTHYTNPELLEKAKSRCTDCHAETTKRGLYWCDEGNCDITEVLNCKEYKDEEVGRIK